jgi:hypothetical protein
VKRGKALPPERIAQARAQRARELQAIVLRLDAELQEAGARLAAADNPAQRAALETEMVHLRLALSRLKQKPCD